MTNAPLALPFGAGFVVSAFIPWIKPLGDWAVGKRERITLACKSNILSFSSEKQRMKARTSVACSCPTSTCSATQQYELPEQHTSRS